MLTLPTGSSADIFTQVRDAAVFVSLSVNTAAASVGCGAIAHLSAWQLAGVQADRFKGL